MRALDGMMHWIIDRGYRILRPIYHYFLAIVYWSRGQKVPRVQDPILQMSATELAEQIREGKLSSESVIRSFIVRILEVDPLINAIVDRRFNDALKEAKDVDALIASRTVPSEKIAREKPLLGVPFTVKGLIAVKGLRISAGSLLFKDVHAQEDSVAVAQLKNAGAIVLATTNTAELGMNFETNNHLHGITCNPYDTSKTSGGSSGGEGAILGAAGSVIGVGNDMAGSIRVPSMFCGIFGHKPTRGLVSNEGVFPVAPAKTSLLLYTGPMCRYATDLVTMLKILAVPGETKNMFEHEIAFQGVKVYYMRSFGENLCLSEEVDPEIQEAVKKAASYFETKHGSKVKEVSLPLFRKSSKIYMHNLLSSLPNAAETMTAGKVHVDPLQELVKVIFRQSQFTTGVVVAMNGTNVPFLFYEDMVDYYKKQEQLLGKQLSDLLDESSVLILPTLPFAAPYHNEIPFLLGSTCYTSIFNTLGVPITQCPLGLNKQGLPIGVQIVSRKGNDHLPIACAIELEKAFGGWIPPN